MLRRSLKFGRLPRSYNPQVPQLGTLMLGKTAPPPPASVDYTHGMPQRPNSFGTMLNDALSDCTCAAFYHARQVWTFHTTGHAQTAPDSDVEFLYEKACGYRRGTGEGPGGNEQHVLTYLHKHGAPIGRHGPPQDRPVDKILGFVEIDPTRRDDVKRAIHDSGLVYIGFNVPANVMPDDGDPPRLWDVAPGHPKIVESHAVICPGYDAEHAVAISWGELYRMTWRFFEKYVDEVYQIADAAWHGATAHSLPAGVTSAELLEAMRGV